jgi:hypothetical protein
MGRVDRESVDGTGAAAGRRSRAPAAPGHRQNPAPAGGPVSAPRRVLALQRLAGNGAVARLLAEPEPRPPALGSRSTEPVPAVQPTRTRARVEPRSDPDVLRGHIEAWNDWMDTTNSVQHLSRDWPEQDDAAAHEADEFLTRLFRPIAEQAKSRARAAVVKKLGKRATKESDYGLGEPVGDVKATMPRVIKTLVDTLLPANAQYIEGDLLDFLATATVRMRSRGDLTSAGAGASAEDGVKWMLVNTLFTRNFTTVIQPDRQEMDPPTATAMCMFFASMAFPYLADTGAKHDQGDWRTQLTTPYLKQRTQFWKAMMTRIDGRIEQLRQSGELERRAEAGGHEHESGAWRERSPSRRSSARIRLGSSRAGPSGAPGPAPPESWIPEWIKRLYTGARNLGSRLWRFLRRLWERPESRRASLERANPAGSGDRTAQSSDRPVGPVEVGSTSLGELVRFVVRTFIEDFDAAEELVGLPAYQERLAGEFVQHLHAVDDKLASLASIDQPELPGPSEVSFTPDELVGLVMPCWEICALCAYAAAGGGMAWTAKLMEGCHEQVQRLGVAYLRVHPGADFPAELTADEPPWGGTVNLVKPGLEEARKAAAAAVRDSTRAERQRPPWSSATRVRGPRASWSPGSSPRAVPGAWRRSGV